MTKVNKSPEQFLWVEAYRPKTLDECILPEALLAAFKEMVKKGEVQNMIFSGTAGVGKTTVARALCEELGCDYLLINASEESGIDVLRTKIRQFASSVSFTGKGKVVILDEADYLNPTSTQPALRGFIEEFSAGCRFIFTCNHKNRIISALHSRTAGFEFKLPAKEKSKVAAAFYKRVLEILKLEGIKYDEKVVATLIQKYFPDNRRILNELQRYSASGVIDEGILAQVADTNIKVLVSSMKAKDWKQMRQWVADNADNDPAQLYRLVYDALAKETDQLPQLVLLVADYSYKAAFAMDQQINMTACLTEIMGSLEFNK